MNTRTIVIALLCIVLGTGWVMANTTPAAPAPDANPATPAPAVAPAPSATAPAPAVTPAAPVPAPPAATPAKPLSPEQEAAEAKLKAVKAEIEAAEQELRLLKVRADLAQYRQDEQRAKIVAELKAKAELAEQQLKAQQADVALAKYGASDEANGVYKFFDEVTEESIKKAIDALDTMSRARPKQPITIVLNSPGGLVYDGLALYDHLRALSARGHHITVVVRGMAASMGGILLQAGDTRIIGRESELLIHEVASGASGKVNEMLERVKNSEHLWVKLSKILARRSTMPVTDPNNPNVTIANPTLEQRAESIRRKAFKFDWWLDAEEAVRLGFADKIE
jgi:ATP-dependent protease ClpP protease subunit